MSVSSVLAASRVAAESRMTDTCTITAPGVGSPVFDPDTGQYTDPSPVTVYSGKCRVQTAAVVNPFNASAGEASVTVQQSYLHLPVDDSTDVEVGNTVTITAATFDPDLVDRVFGVVGIHAKSQASARRLLVQEVTGS